MVCCKANPNIAPWLFLIGFIIGFFVWWDYKNVPRLDRVRDAVALETTKSIHNIMLQPVSTHTRSKEMTGIASFTAKLHGTKIFIVLINYNFTFYHLIVFSFHLYFLRFVLSFLFVCFVYIHF